MARGGDRAGAAASWARAGRGASDMQLGVYVNAQHPAGDDPARRFAEMVEQVRLIRTLGFDSIWGGEHHATPGFHYFPLLPLLQRLAAEAEGLWVGTNLVLLPLHNPVEVAEIGAFLDVITGGRFLLGVGSATGPRSSRIFGVPMAERVSRLVEGIEIIRRLWTRGARHPSRPPLAARRGRRSGRGRSSGRGHPSSSASQVPAGIARAARIADGWLVVPVPTVDEFAAQAAAFAEARAAAGLPPSRHVGRLIEVACAPRRGHGDPPRGAVSPREVRGLPRPGASRASPSTRARRPRHSSAAWRRIDSPSAPRPRWSRPFSRSTEPG